MAALAAVMPAAAQTSRGDGIEGRVDRLEREMRAVQRKVFPGGAGQTIEPQIIAPQQLQAPPGQPATSAVADLNARVSAVESQLSQMTGQIEQGQYRLRQLEEAFNAYRRATDARLKVLEAGAAPAEAEEPVTGAVRPGPARPAVGGPATPTVNVDRPKSEDPAEDGYIYGYRLWQAKQYDKAIPELRAVVQKYPKHRRASYSQNLLGRTLLDQGKPALAATAFFESYQKMPNGERAPDSLYYLAQALVKMKKPASEVCKVYDELTQVYGDRLSEAMKMDVATGRSASKCK
ncbi:tetratricopeptide repeat protein [Sphingomonas sp. BT-65]|uniref:tetratricopeptide repeat protein n=1 Tax=Sphingomonas sp. BT-65 TaxID=2989821 RepID=UPI00223549A1|nr:tetratricopeptide repeat protein [Sphingomonas sp. BT-65]MCW4462113.1 tetratricopeptide repeat protein [Sphingomonas sp. BT-65]